MVYVHKHMLRYINAWEDGKWSLFAQRDVFCTIWLWASHTRLKAPDSRPTAASLSSAALKSVKLFTGPHALVLLDTIQVIHKAYTTERITEL